MINRCETKRGGSFARSITRLPEAIRRILKIVLG